MRGRPLRGRAAAAIASAGMATAAAPSTAETLPVRGPAARRLGLALPPDRMPLVRDGRPLKRWRYVGVYTAELMLCVGEAHVAGLPQRWWAVALPDGTLVERTTFSRGGVELSPGRVRVAARAATGTDVSIELELGDAAPVEVVSPHGGSYIWTAKRAPVQAGGEVRLGGKLFSCHGEHGFIDESAGYHARRTAWRWSAGVGRSSDGRAVAWNLVDGVHDAPEASERTVWIDGEPHEVAPQLFAADLSRVGDLAFERWSAREHSMSLGLARSRYVQPFGRFSGVLPGGAGGRPSGVLPGGAGGGGNGVLPGGAGGGPSGAPGRLGDAPPAGLELAEGYGVMEDHDVRW
jgi:Domain of unknown function (DUF2804), C-terminal